MTSIVPLHPPHKQCRTCEEWKPATLEFFNATPVTSDHLMTQCKECRRKYRSDRKNAQPLPIKIPEGQKRCITCKQIYPATLEYFGVRNDTSSGLVSQCKECKNASGRNKYVKKVRPVFPEGYKRCASCRELKLATTENFKPDKSHPDGLGSSCRQCRQGQNARLEEQIRQTSQLPPEGTLKRCSKCKQLKPATLEVFSHSAGKRDCLQRHCKQCASEAHKVAYTNNRHVFVAYHHNRQSRERAIPGKHTAQDIADQLKRQRNKCYYCKAKLGTGKKAFQVDHIIPVTREGSSNDPWNLVIACSHCNSSKHNKLLHEWPKGGRLF